MLINDFKQRKKVVLSFGTVLVINAEVVHAEKNAYVFIFSSDFRVNILTHIQTKKEEKKYLITMHSTLLC